MRFCTGETSWPRQVGLAPEGSHPLAGMTMSLGGVKVVSLVVSCHAMNALKGARPDSPPNIHASTAQHVAHVRLTDSCLQAQRIAGIGGSARNQAESLCNHYKEAHFRWGLVSFFNGAPQEPRGWAALARCRPRAVCAHGRTVLATASEPAHDLGLCGDLLFEMDATMCGSWAWAVAVRSAVVAITHYCSACPMTFLYACVCTGSRV